MTVIVWDGKTLAADKRSLNNGVASTTTKISRVPIGPELLGISGDHDAGVALMQWYVGGRNGPYPNNRDANGELMAVLLVIDGSGRILRYEREPHPLVFEDKFYAMGSGRDFALAALHLGHDARKAVEVASALDVGCGNGIDTLTLTESNT